VVARLKRLLCRLVGHKWELEEDTRYASIMTCLRCDTSDNLFSGRWHRAEIEEILTRHRERK
jgi:hypothetical protein